MVKESLISVHKVNDISHVSALLWRARLGPKLGKTCNHGAKRDMGVMLVHLAPARSGRASRGRRPGASEREEKAAAHRPSPDE